ncbi:MAG: hypothetical protein K2M75_01940 [Clostridia bacterium]|nr:hypothetical protein [Clostridia bacterium]
MNLKRMEAMLGDLNENFDRHVSTAIANYYFVLSAAGGACSLKIRLYSQGGNAELELLAFASGNTGVEFSIKVDGELVDERKGAITIAPLALARGWRVIEITGQGVSSGRARVSGSVSGASALLQ